MTKTSATESRRPHAPREPKGEDDAVLEAAAGVFRRKGFAAATVREIAQAASMLPGSLHYRYPSKEALLLALMERAVDRATRAIRAAVEASRDPAERLRLALRAHLKTLLSGDASVHVLLYDWRALEGEARAALVRLRDGYEALWDGLLYEAVGAGLARDGVDVRLVRLFGFGAINWVAQWYRPGGARTPEQIADAFWGYLAFGLLADDRRPRDISAALHALSATDRQPPTRPKSRTRSKGRALAKGHPRTKVLAATRLAHATAGGRRPKARARHPGKRGR